MIVFLSDRSCLCTKRPFYLFFYLIMVLRDLKLQGLIKYPQNHKANHSIPNHFSSETGAKHFLWCSSETGHFQPNG